MIEAEVREAVTAFLAEEFPARAAEIAALPADAPLFELGLVDSLSFLGMVSALEARFAIRVPPADFAPQVFRSLSEIARYVERARR